MVHVSRRTFLGGMAAMPLALWTARHAHAFGSYVRYDAASPEGLDMLGTYADAVALMQARPDQDPRAWLWQWYTHFVTGTTNKSAEITRIFGTSTSSLRNLANETWNTCQSHAGQNSNHFLPWHRMFTFFFEDIVRTVSGRADFTLPYWNYTSDDPALRGIVPLQFRQPTDPRFGVLYRPNRTSLANTGQPIHKNQPTDVMDISAAMATANYSTVNSVLGFCRAIDSGIHGRIHVLVGTSKNMGAVPYAAGDPLFWVHHAAVDRMWASWNATGGLNPATATWANKTFAFADSRGQRVSGRLKDFFDTAKLGYGYDALIAPAPASLAAGVLNARTSSGRKGLRVAASPAALDLGERSARTLLRPTALAPSAAPVLGLDRRPSGRRTYLVLRNLHTWRQPEVLYHVYLTPPGGGSLDRASHVGVIQFFDAEFHDHGNSPLDTALGDNFYSFDVTDVLRGMERAGRRDAGQSLAVTIVPAGRPRREARPLVATLELVVQ